MQMSRYPQLLLCYATEHLRLGYLEIGIHTEGIYRAGPVRREEGWEDPRLGGQLCAVVNETSALPSL